MLGSTFFLALVLLGLASAAPRPNEGLKPKWAQEGHQLNKRSFRIDRVQTGSGSPSAVKALYKAYSKWSIPMPDSLVQAHTALQKKKKKKAKPAGAGAGAAANTTAAAAGQTGNVTNTPEQGDVEFLAPITVGGQKMVMDFDTGSSDLWVFSTSLPANQQTGHTNFDPTKSQTFKQLQGNSFAITFGDGSNATGNIVGTDTVNIGGATATNQAVELASAVSGSFVTDTQSNGLVGLAFSKINTVKPQQQKTFFDTISPQLAQPVLVANLKAGANGFYAFGEVDQTAFKGNLSAVAVDNSNGFWQVTSNAFKIGNDQVQQAANANPAIADTGTTLLIVDDAVAQAYYKTVQGAALNQQQGLFTFPCTSQLQDLSVALGNNYMATIDKSLLNFEQIDAQTCAGAVQGNQGSNLQIYGDILFKSQFAVFNNKDNTVSFAPHA
ncbi:hypothetical protein MMC10_005321 [Thelotrema lepadinum]|nr:hypothetical protein [Thelotrema lepadinum]